MILAYTLGLLAGVGTTIQGNVNSKVRLDVKSPYIATILSFATAIATQSVVVLIKEGDLQIDTGAISGEPVWILAGGLCGFIIIIMAIFCIPVLDAARNAMIVNFGQLMTGLIIDQFGLFGSVVNRMTVMKAAGAVLVMAGIVMVSLEDVRADGSKGISARVLLYSLLTVTSGIACAVQIAVNGRLGEVIASAPKATFISVSAGFFNTLFVIIGIMLFKGRRGIYNLSGPEEAIPKFRFEWLMLCGGPLACVIVGSNAAAGPVLGTNPVVILNLIGMMGVGLIVDAIGFLGTDIKPVTKIKIAGMLVMLAGAVMITLL